MLLPERTSSFLIPGSSRHSHRYNPDSRTGNPPALQARPGIPVVHDYPIRHLERASLDGMSVRGDGCQNSFHPLPKRRARQIQTEHAVHRIKRMGREHGGPPDPGHLIEELGLPREHTAPEGILVLDVHNVASL